MIKTCGKKQNSAPWPSHASAPISVKEDVAFANQPAGSLREQTGLVGSRRQRVAAVPHRVRTVVQPFFNPLAIAPHRPRPVSSRRGHPPECDPRHKLEQIAIAPFRDASSKLHLLPPKFINSLLSIQ